MIKNIRHSTSAPEADTGCRMADFNNNDIIRRNRLRLRRIRSSPSVSSGEENLQKRKKNGDSKHELVFSTSTKKLSISPESDVILPGTSSYVGGGDETSKGSVEKVTCWSHGSISVIGRRRDMEDAVAIEQGFINKGFRKYDFFGIYDGHGGVRVAHACSERLHEVIIKEVEQEVDEEVIDWEKVMISSFHKMDEEVNKNNGSAVAMMGSTAVVAVVGDQELVVANCGDSRAVVCRDGAAVALSDDHKPERPDELARVEGCGGKVINWNGQRVLGVLATSRSIGDRYLKPFVISEPEVRVMKRTNKDEFLILGSDGLWDVISNDLACEIVKKCLDGQLRRTFKSKDENNSSASNKNSETVPAIAAALLAELAIARGSRDNISVIVVELKRLG